MTRTIDSHSMMFLSLLLATLMTTAVVQGKKKNEGLLVEGDEDQKLPDWLLVDPMSLPPAAVTSMGDDVDAGDFGGKAAALELSNGLVTRRFVVSPDFACVSFVHQGELGRQPTEALRAVSPEARVTLDGVSYRVGGLVLPSPLPGVDACVPGACGDAAARGIFTDTATLESMVADPNAFHYSSHEIFSQLEAPYDWTPGTRHAPSNAAWPPAGARLRVHFKAPASAPARHQSVVVTIEYELLRGLPVVTKRVTVADTPPPPLQLANEGSGEGGGGSGRGGRSLPQQVPIVVSGLTIEELAVTRPYGPLPLSGSFGGHGVDSTDPFPGRLWVQADEPHGPSVSWQNDVRGSGAPGAQETLLNASYALPFEVDLDPTLPGTENGALRSFRVLELLLPDGATHERFGMALKRMRRTLAPAVQENPIFMHLTVDPRGPIEAVEAVIDQMKQVGFEMAMFSFGSGFDIESTDPAFLAKARNFTLYARARGIEVGAYDLISLTRNPPNSSWQQISPSTGKPDGDTCFASEWNDYLTAALERIVSTVGLSAIETDGPYGGDPCASEDHAYHRGIGDSVFRENVLQARFYVAAKKLGMYIHQPDNENQFSLPRWIDLQVSRAGIFDDLYSKPTTLGWGFLPLVDYHGGGAAAAFEPLTEHAAEYEWALAQYFGTGVMPCWRGDRLFDSNATKAMVEKWVNFYKQHRQLVTSDVVHVRYPDGAGIDALLHVNSQLQPYQGLLVAYNPTRDAVDSSLYVNLYYTGIENRARVAELGAQANAQELTLARDYSVQVRIKMAPLSATWFTISSSD